MSSLSIDIGKKNLGFSVVYNDNENSNKKIIFFDLFNIEKEIQKEKSIKKLGVVVQRAFVLDKFLTEIIEKYNIKKIIIERQVQTNTIAMELMYCIVSLCITKIDVNNLIIYDPKKKFTDLNLAYTTKNKEHKKLSINICEKYINELYPNEINKFNEFAKKDDIADSILMNLLENNIIK